MFNKKELINIHVVTCIVSWISLIAGVVCAAMGLAEWGMYSLKWVYFTNAIVCVFAFLITHYIGRDIHRYILSLNENPTPTNERLLMYFFFIDTFYIAPFNCDAIFTNNKMMFSIKTTAGYSKIKLLDSDLCSGEVHVSQLCDPINKDEPKDVISFCYNGKEYRFVVDRFIINMGYPIGIISEDSSITFIYDCRYETVTVYDRNEIRTVVLAERVRE